MKNLKIHDYKSLKDLHWDEYHNGEYSKEKQHYLYQSSGVAHFKTVRKAMPHIEYTGVYPLHLPWWSKLPWKSLYFVIQKCILPLMKKYKL